MYLTQSLHRAVQQTPDQIATVCGERVRTFREHVDRVSALAGALRATGVAQGDRVAILSQNSDRYQEFLYAVWWMGGAVNLVNTRWSNKEITYSLEESGTRVLFVDDTFVGRVPELVRLWDGLTTLVHCGEGTTPEGMLGYEELIATHDPVQDERLGGDRLAGVFYTGGTTGLPKGVMLSHASMLTSVLGAAASLQVYARQGTSLQSAPLFHLAALASLNGTVVAGGTNVFLPAFEPVSVLKSIHTHRPTSLLLVPAMIQMLVDHPTARDYDLSSVQRIAYGASPISEAVLDRAMTAFPGAGFVQAYGMTELSPAATGLTAEDHLHKHRLRSAGRALASTEVRVVDIEDREVPRGTVGEVVARGGNVMLGYWNKPEETAEALRGGWMHTGDAGYLDEEGYLYLVDRMKDMIVTGGENVYSAEVENAVAKHPAVASCAVIGVPDATWGERIHAVIVLQPGRGSTAEEIREHCKALIAGYKSPRTCEFVESLPLSPAGKILKRDLRKPYWENAERSVN
ncbi:long-chain fatty acid--CoA ligase [Streptomyces sp. LN590]|uniref:acyl-CoA synthetase n=1 Tax=unclassified Streptomyces TaxID=2593676 RepID=UPI003713C03E